MHVCQQHPVYVFIAWPTILCSNHKSLQPLLESNNNLCDLHSPCTATTLLSNKHKEMSAVSGRLFLNFYLQYYLLCFLTHGHIATQCNSPMISKYIPFYPLGLDWDSISECVQWMVPFVNVAKKVPVKLKNFKKVAAEDRHNIQTHTNYLDMLVSGCGCAVWSCPEAAEWPKHLSAHLNEYPTTSDAINNMWFTLPLPGHKQTFALPVLERCL